MKCARYGLIAILLSIVVLPLSAMAVPLDDLLATTITQGDALHFSNFSASLFTFSAFSIPQDLSEIDVSGITVNGESGLRIGPAFFAPPNASSESGVRLLLGFDVMALNPHQPIHGVTLTISELFIVGGSSSVFASAGSTLVGAGGVSPSEGPPVEGSVSATRALESDMRRLHIDAEIEVSTGFSPFGFATAGPVDVTFAQSVPEPSIVLLLVSGAGLITAMAHKVRQA